MNLAATRLRSNTTSTIDNPHDVPLSEPLKPRSGLGPIQSNGASDTSGINKTSTIRKTIDHTNMTSSPALAAAVSAAAGKHDTSQGSGVSKQGTDTIQSTPSLPRELGVGTPKLSQGQIERLHKAGFLVPRQEKVLETKTSTTNVKPRPNDTERPSKSQSAHPTAGSLDRSRTSTESGPSTRKPLSHGSLRPDTSVDGHAIKPIAPAPPPPPARSKLGLDGGLGVSNGAVTAASRVATMMSQKRLSSSNPPPTMMTANKRPVKQVFTIQSPLTSQNTQSRPQPQSQSHEADESAHTAGVPEGSSSSAAAVASRSLTTSASTSSASLLVTSHDTPSNSESSGLYMPDIPHTMHHRTKSTELGTSSNEGAIDTVIGAVPKTEQPFTPGHASKGSLSGHKPILGNPAAADSVSSLAAAVKSASMADEKEKQRLASAEKPKARNEEVGFAKQVWKSSLAKKENDQKPPPQPQTALATVQHEKSIQDESAVSASPQRKPSKVENTSQRNLPLHSTTEQTSEKKMANALAAAKAAKPRSQQAFDAIRASVEEHKEQHARKAAKRSRKLKHMYIPSARFTGLATNNPPKPDLTPKVASSSSLPQSQTPTSAAQQHNHEPPQRQDANLLSSEAEFTAPSFRSRSPNILARGELLQEHDAVTAARSEESLPSSLGRPRHSRSESLEEQQRSSAEQIGGFSRSLLNLSTTSPKAGPDTSAMGDGFPPSFWRTPKPGAAGKTGASKFLRRLPFAHRIKSVHNPPPDQYIESADSPKKVNFRSTMRKEGRSKSFNEDKPWKHHSDVIALTSKEKERYEGLWAANRGIHMSYTLESRSHAPFYASSNEEISRMDVSQSGAESGKEDDDQYHGDQGSSEANSFRSPSFVEVNQSQAFDTTTSSVSQDQEQGSESVSNNSSPAGAVAVSGRNSRESLMSNPGRTSMSTDVTPVTGSSNELSSAENVHGFVVRDLWRRSRLSDATLSRIWTLVDRNFDGTLSRESFLVGMWLVDQCLYGRKLPTQLAPQVWSSVGRLNVKIRLHRGKSHRDEKHKQKSKNTSQGKTHKKIKSKAKSGAAKLT